MTRKFLAALLVVFAINELNASVNTGHAVVSLKSDLVSQNVDNFHLAINFKMDEGWHTYWSNPGDSGGPLEVSWNYPCLLYTSPSPRDVEESRMPSSA
mgnify:CR=1 FL=1